METIYLNPSMSINAAIEKVRTPATICLSNGVYREKVKISKPDVAIVGSSRDKCKIVFGDYANKIHADGKEFNTFRTYTLGVFAPFVSLSNVTVENDSGNPKEKGQAVALHVCADSFRASDCAFISMQDTVFNGPLPADLIERYVGFLPDDERTFCGRHSLQVFSNCLVAGSVDFIFGTGDAFYINCEIKSVFDGRSVGYVAAPAHALTDDSALSFVNCRFTAENVKPASIFLARPWRDYGRAIFIDCAYGEHISPLGFDKWNDTDRDKTARFYEGFSPDAGGAFDDRRVYFAKRFDEAQTNRFKQLAAAYFLK